MALAAATDQDDVTSSDVTLLQEAEVARAARLRELRKAATEVALVGEYYKLQAKSRFATRLGPLCAGFGIMSIVGSSHSRWPKTRHADSRRLQRVRAGVDGDSEP
jgi:hypothetical protein